MSSIESAGPRTAGPGARRWVVLAAAGALIFMAYLMQYQMSALSYLIVPAYGAGLVELSNLMFAPLLLAAALGTPLGMLGDRFGVRRVVGACLVVALAGAALRALAASYGVALAGMLLIGFAPAALNANVTKLLGAWFGDRSSLAIGIYYACSGLGAAAAMLSATVTASLAQAFGGALVALAAVAAFWFAAARNRPAGAAGADGPTAGGASPTGALDTVRYLGRAARSVTVWQVALITGLGLAAKTAYLGFLPQALETSLDAQAAAALASFVTYGGIVGCALGPTLCLRVRSQRAFVIGCTAAASALIFVTAATLDRPLAGVLFAAGVISSATAPVVEAIPLAVPELRDCIGSAGGIVGTVSLAMSYALPLGIAVVAGGSFAAMTVLTGACMLAAVPVLAALPGFTPAEVAAGLDRRRARRDRRR